MRITQPLPPRRLPRFDEVPTLAEMPVTGTVSAEAVNAAIKLTDVRQKVRRFVEAARYARAIACEIARIENAVEASLSPAEALKTALRRLFMVSMGYYHVHLGSPMPAQIWQTLQRLYQASQGGRVDASDLFADLRTLGACEASQCDMQVGRAIEAAEQALLSMRMG